MLAHNKAELPKDAVCGIRQKGAAWDVKTEGVGLQSYRLP